MSEILLMKRISRDGLEEITAYDNAKDVAGYLWGKRLDSICWIIKFNDALIQPSNLKGKYVSEVAKEIAAFGRKEEKGDI